MTRPEKRWQLLLVADDGRIVPFKRIKGIAVTLVVLLAILALVCAGLGWRLTVNSVKQRRTLEQLTDAKRRVAQYKSELELTIAELVLAEARMEKAGLAIPRRQERAEQQPVKTADAAVVSDTAAETIVDESEHPTPPAAAKQPAIPTEAAMTKPVAPEKKTADVQAASANATAAPAVALGDLKLKHDTAKKVLLARFRVNNTGPRSNRVAGRCVVVLKNDRMDRQAWLAMPDVTLVNGKPDGEKGQLFRISRFIDMKIKAVAPADPSSYNEATVYVFDEAGSTIVKKDFPIDLPAPKPVTKGGGTPVVQPAAEIATTGPPAVPALSPPTDMPVEATANLPKATPADTDTGQGRQPVPPQTPADDPSLIESDEPVKKEDARSRF